MYLGAVRPIALENFPAQFREALTRADATFRNGVPDKACALVFDEIESICRIAAKRTYASGYWKQTVSFNFERDPWARLMKLMADHLDLRKTKCRKLSPALLARIHGVTPHRNESGHKLRTPQAVMRRDRELRTRFEGAVDLLSDLIVAVKPLRIF